MIFYPFRYALGWIMVGAVLMALSNDYVIISRRRYEKLKTKAKGNDK